LTVAPLPDDQDIAVHECIRVSADGQLSLLHGDNVCTRVLLSQHLNDLVQWLSGVLLRWIYGCVWN
jgi:UDP-2,3-diacylglucosamine pyrophosphatase LpxH